MIPTSTVFYSLLLLTNFTYSSLLLCICVSSFSLHLSFLVPLATHSYFLAVNACFLGLCTYVLNIYFDCIMAIRRLWIDIINLVILSQINWKPLNISNDKIL